MTVQSASGKELLVRTGFDDGAAGKNENPVTGAHGAQSVGDDHTSPLGHEALKCVLDEMLTLGIE